MMIVIIHYDQKPKTGKSLRKLQDDDINIENLFLFVS